MIHLLDAIKGGVFIKKSLFLMYLGLFVLSVIGYFSIPYLYVLFAYALSELGFVLATVVPLALVLGTQIIWLRHIKKTHEASLNVNRRIPTFWLICTLVFPISIILLYLMPMIVWFFVFGGFILYIPLLILGIIGVFHTITVSYLHMNLNHYAHKEVFYGVIFHLVFTIVLWQMMANRIIMPLGTSH